MTKREIKIEDYAGEIMSELKKGILVTTKSGDKVNTMTISWGALGIDWAFPVFTTYIRQGRFTHRMLEENPEFTVNIPFGPVDRSILGYCGSKSGRDYDKIQDLGLTTVDAEEISVPAIRELPLTLECRVIYAQKQDERAIPAEILDKFYPKDVDASHHDRNQTLHTAFYGQIVKAYVIED